MRPADIEKLLGGYATGTLTPEEQAALFEAALTNQALFDALADEETLRELLADERARAELLDALQPPAPARPRGLLAWIYARPVPVALAASVAVAVLAIGVLRYRSPEEQKVAMVDKAPMDPSVLALEQLPPEVRPKEKAPPPKASPDRPLRKWQRSRRTSSRPKSPLRAKRSRLAWGTKPAMSRWLRRPSGRRVPRPHRL